ncbi:MAG: hypothetical protein ACTHM9_12715 [Gemmatimonadales bacterium]
MPTWSRIWQSWSGRSSSRADVVVPGATLVSSHASCRASRSPEGLLHAWTTARVALLFLAVLTGAPRAGAQHPPRLAEPDRVRLAEARELAARVSDHVWPGWGRTPFPVLLITDSVEFLSGAPEPDEGFVRSGFDSVLQQAVWTRPRQFPPTLLATFPAVGGKPTVVIGRAERTGKSSTAWVTTLLHEHFHQWQTSRPDYYAGVTALGLAHGDTSGQWMLDYPFPYDSAPVQRAVRQLATALRRALDAPTASRRDAVAAVVAARDELRSRLDADDYRYLEFQFWQEGTARFVEYAVLKAAAAGPSSRAFRSLPDYEPYAAELHGRQEALRRELDALTLGSSRRVAFYPLGAAIALLLDQIRPDWKRVYTERPFTLASLLPRGPSPALADPGH